eukprot:688470-Amphidinium_carterae.2
MLRVALLCFVVTALHSSYCVDGCFTYRVIPPSHSLSSSMDRTCGFMIFADLSRVQSTPTLPEFRIHDLKMAIHRGARHWCG